jgi:eukaryotic-like serine/threonine-protein kinase
MGAVYRVYDAELGLEVALKMLRGMSQHHRSWVKAEFRSLSSLVHPNLVQLYELVIDDTYAFFTMEQVRGLDFSHYVRQLSGATGSLTVRLRAAGRQLAHALASCHAADKLHRDVKPSNVLVTDAGRVVLLDFGLVAPMHHAKDPDPNGHMAGTLGYMAPEQAWGQPLTAAADWYGFGATLYEAATGRLPFLGKAHALLPIRGRPPTPSEIEPSIPPDLDDLIMRLLSPGAEQRPGQAEILDVLGGTSFRGPVSVPPSDRSRSTAPFVNRSDEFAALRAAWQRARAGEPVVVCLRGASGIGKTEVVRRFIERSEAASEAWILRGRCHPEETVPFNALDGALDDLASALRQVDPNPLFSLNADELDGLVRLFPILSSDVSEDRQRPEAPAAPLEIRRRALAGLKQILVSMSRHRTPLIWLDDLQWGDSDSGALLRDLLSTHTGPPFLLIVSYRDGDVGMGHALELLHREPSVLGGERSMQLLLRPLTETDSVGLIRELVDKPQLRAGERITQLCREAAGYPFLLREVARYLREGGDDRAGAQHVSDMLEFRMRQLPEQAREIVQIVSVAGGPIEHRTILQAGSLDAESVTLFAMLERLAILRTTAGALRTTEVYHHRIRDHVLARMDASTHRALHAAIANALLGATSPNLQRILEHFERAEDTAAVRRYVVPAARQAFDGFAFERAVVLYRKAIEVGASELDDPELYTRLGHALANSGQARAAGEAYERATSILAARPQADTGQILSLRRAAAEQYLQSGHERPAIKALREVLAIHRVKMPRTRSEAIGRGLALRVGLLLRKLDVPTRHAAQAPRALLERFDASWAVGVRLSMVNHAQISYFAARCLDIALETREPSRLALALSLEASALSMMGTMFSGRVDQMIELARRLAEPCGAYERAMVSALTAATAWLRGHFRLALELDDVASDLLNRSPHEFHWERAMFDTWSLAALALLGEYRELSERVQRALKDAQRRDDRYLARNCYLGEPSLTWIALDKPDWAIEKANLAIAWSPVEFTTQHYHHYLTLGHALLYMGDATTAFSLTAKVWPQLRRNLFLAVSTVKEELTHLRASISLAVAEQLIGEQRFARHTASALVRRVRKQAKDIARPSTPVGQAWSALLLAGAEGVEEHWSEARGHLVRAIELLRRTNLAGYEHAARFHLGCLTSGTEGALLQRQALDWFSSQGVLDPQRFIRMLAPGFTRVTTSRSSSAPHTATSPEAG